MKWLAAALAIKAAAHIPVLLPQTIPYTGGMHVYAIVEQSSSKGYTVDFAGDPRCNGAHVCSFAHVTGSASPMPLGYVAPICAAYCSDGTLTWKHGAAYYRISLKAGALKDLRAMAATMKRY